MSSPQEHADQLLLDFAVPHVRDVALTDLRIPGAVAPARSLVWLPVGWIMASCVVVPAKAGDFSISFVFDPVFIPISAGLAVDGPKIRRGSRSPEDFGKRVASAINSSWPPLRRRFATPSAYLTHAISPIDEAERSDYRYLVLQGAGCRILMDDVRGARADLSSLVEGGAAASGGEEAALFYAFALLKAVNEGLPAARSQLSAWRTQRLAPLRLQGPAAPAEDLPEHQ